MTAKHLTTKNGDSVCHNRTCSANKYSDIKSIQME